MKTSKFLSLCCFCAYLIHVNGQTLPPSAEVNDPKVFQEFKKQTPATDEELIRLQELITSSYSKNADNADFLIKNLDQLSGDRMVTGYRILFDLMLAANQLRNPYTLPLMHRTIMGLENPAISDINKIDLYYIQEKMPSFIRDFPFSEGIYFESRFGDKKDLLATGDFILPNNNRDMFAWLNDCLLDECVWDLEPVPGETTFRFKNRKYKEYATVNAADQAVLIKPGGDLNALAWHFYPAVKGDFWSMKNKNKEKVFCRYPRPFKFNGKEFDNRRILVTYHNAKDSFCNWKIMGELEFIQRASIN